MAKVNVGNDLQSFQMGGDVVGNAGVSTTAPSATTYTLDGKTTTLNQYAGHIIVAGSSAVGCVYGIIQTTTAATPGVVTVDHWYNPACVDEATEILTSDGWKTVDTLQVGDLILGLDHDGSGLARWEPVLDVCVYPVAECNMVELRSRQYSSLTTPNHRWPVQDAESSKRKWVQTDGLTAHHRLFSAAAVSNLPTVPKYEDAFVALVGWFCTEGHIEMTHGKPANNVLIHQSMVNERHVETIRACLTTLVGPPTSSFPRLGRTLPTEMMWREDAPQTRPHERIFHLNSLLGAALQSVAPNRVMTHDFVTSLTLAQLGLLWQTWIDGDGDSATSVTQAKRERLEPLQTVLTLLGAGSSLRETTTNGWSLSRRTFDRIEPIGGKATRRDVTYQGRIWCPKTPSTAWLARREGRTFFTGNTPNATNATTPLAGPWAILIGAHPACFVACSASGLVGVGATTLSGEITTASGGLLRQRAPYAHTPSAASYTLTPVFTVLAADSIPVTILKIGVFNSAIVGATVSNLLFETAITPATATLSAINDSVTVTSTVTL